MKVNEISLPSWNTGTINVYLQGLNSQAFTVSAVSNTGHNKSELVH